MKLLVILYFSFIFSSAAFAQRSSPEYRSRMKLQQSTRLICKFRNSLKRAAEEQGLESKYLIACLLSEYAYLKGPSDDLIDAAASVGLYDNPSLGIAQIRLSTGKALAKKIYGEARTNEQVIADLLHVPTAARYMSLLVSQIISDYAHFGFDISESPQLICSSYLVGGSFTRAQNHVKNGTVPQSNYYGNYALKNFGRAEQIQSGEACPPPAANSRRRAQPSSQ